MADDGEEPSQPSRGDDARVQARPALDDIEAALDDVAATLAQMG